MEPVKGKAALVTGASRGIGRATAIMLAERGARVACLGRDEEALQEVVKVITTSGGEAFHLYCDVRNEWSVQRTVEDIRDQLDTIDILINNAGVGIRGRIEDYTLTEWRSTIDTNLTGVFLFCRAAIPIMREQKGGRIINVSSGAGRNGIAGHGAYCASKFGLMGLTDTLGHELRDAGILVSAVVPGSTDTSFSGRTPKSDEGRRSETGMMSPFEVAEAIVNLCETNPNAWTSELTIRPLRPNPAT